MLRACPTFLLCLGLAFAQPITASEAPLGQADFHPSPERPIGWRGDGNGCFPGANPPTKWGEGTAETVSMSNWDAKRNRWKDSRALVIKEGSSATNIRFKQELPGWGNAQPIVVGERVFLTAEPHTLLCCDAATGAIRWQRSLSPFDLAGQSPTEVEQHEALLGIAHAVRSVGGSITGNYKRLPEPTPERKAAWLQQAKRIERLAEQAVEAAPGSPVSAALAEAAAKLVAATEAIDPAAPDDKAVKYLAKNFGEIADQAMRDLTKSLGIALVSGWRADIGWTFATPVSDGRHVFVTMGQGQAACFDLDGNRVWGRLVPAEKPAPRAQWVPSPLLVGDLFIGQMMEKLVAFDKANGKTVWEAAITPGGGYNVGTHKHLRISVDGQNRDVLATTSGILLDAVDGKPLLNFWKGMSQEGGGPSVIGFGDCFLYEINTWKGRDDNPFGQTGYAALRIAHSNGTWSVTAQTFFDRLEVSGVSPAYSTAGRVYHCKKVGFGIWNTSDGSLLGTTPLRGMRLGSGSPIIWNQGRTGLVYETHGGGDRRSRKDQLIVVKMAVVDFSDPSKPKHIATNVLGGANVPHDPYLERWLPDLHDYHPYNLLSMPGGFGTASPIAHGDTLYIRSHSHLYGIAAD